ncbi:MAG TPA: hypothetical protein VJ895_00675 [Candidatus Nanoarchaeia archaeon]|nr:hypothetical protein [Candidatus Nanoarchaeia archaeon]
MKKFILTVFVIGMLTFMAGFGLAAVNGAETVTEEGSSTATPTAADSHDAIAGNVTELTIEGLSVTQTWQGYFGNVSGAITLENSDGNVMYNWSLASPQGEVYASENNAVTWESIDCFNFSENGAAQETTYNIESDAADGIDETFTGTVGLTVGSQALTGCMSTAVFAEGASQAGTFDEALLWDGSSMIFASILEEDVLGFDGKTHDFQMLVVEDGHNGDTATTPYYFYVELA